MVINCPVTSNHNLEKIFKKIKNKKFINKIKKIKNNYDTKISASLFISKKIEKLNLKEKFFKKFHDLKF